MTFGVGESYTRAEISRALGGEMMTYLPQRDGRILCGCFVPAQGKNPNAPEEVLAGAGPVVERKAEMLCEQEGAIPVFHMGFTPVLAALQRWLPRGACRGSEFVPGERAPQAGRSAVVPRAMSQPGQRPSSRARSGRASKAGRAPRA